MDVTIKTKIRKRIQAILKNDMEKKGITKIDRYAAHVIAKGLREGLYFNMASLRKYLRGTVAPNGTSLLELAHVLEFSLDSIVQDVIDDTKNID